MKSYRANLGGGIDGIVMRDEAIPSPGPHQILVAVRAVSLNARELMILQGYYPLPVKPDLIPVSDGAGEVVAIGDGVTRVKIGDRIAASIFPRWIDGPFGWDYSAQLGGSLDGMLSEYALLPEDAAVQIPPHLSYEEAATLPCAAVTAWNALSGGVPLLPGQTVLTQGSGGVSLFALQLARLFGARVIATTSSDDKAQRLTALGADAVINYRTTPDWHACVREMTGGRGVDVIVEVGGAGTMEQSLKAVALSGQISQVGSLDKSAASIGIAALSATVTSIRRIAVGNRAQFLAMNSAIAMHGLRPVIDSVFAFEDAVEAFRYYARGEAFGKIVIRHD
ncbi:NAD(P)-dependent alcohol dehydrogenase [Mesorhizobium sp. INR15]|uniref:zinc-dependent alcohol dehydrogenase family protein n=1 Tax=Mesorhizobium sp. INR15 TaxID=2654248 RepID=UPI001896A02E|nr:NAD(P)-dependent alcohol dehydrogenase [Mesorhizobium sp. INR15]QPC92278.1 zinc-binding dehydrogenase [Mesorhizobium sp. INR15]